MLVVQSSLNKRVSKLCAWTNTMLNEDCHVGIKKRVERNDSLFNISKRTDIEPWRVYFFCSFFRFFSIHFFYFLFFFSCSCRFNYCFGFFLLLFLKWKRRMLLIRGSEFGCSKSRRWCSCFTRVSLVLGRSRDGLLVGLLHAFSFPNPSPRNWLVVAVAPTRL